MQNASTLVVVERPVLTYRTKSVRRQVWEMTEGRCYYCGTQLDHPESTGHTGVRNFTVDHVIPVSLGGTDALENLVPCCKRCNSSKCDRLIPDWERMGARPRYPFGRHPLSDHKPVEYASVPKQELHDLREENDRLRSAIRRMEDAARIRDELIHHVQKDRQWLADQVDQIQDRLTEANKQILMLMQKVGRHERD